MQVTATEFQQNIGRYQDAARGEPVIVTKHNRPYTVLMSAALFEVLTRGRIARPIEDLDPDTLAAIGRATVPTEHAHLDQLLNDWKP